MIYLKQFFVKENRLLFLSLSVIIIIYSQPVFSISKIDSLEIRLLNSEPIEQVNILCELSKSYFSISPGKAIEYANKAIDLSEENKYDIGMIRAITLLYEINYLNQRFGEALKACNLLTDINRKLKKPEGEAASLDMCANVYIGMEDYTEAIKLFSKALDIRIENNNNDGIGDSYNNIAILFKILNDNETAIRYFEKTIEIFSDPKEKNKLASALIRKGILHEKQGQYKKAIDDLSQALEIFEESGNETDIALCNKYLGICFTEVAEYKQAEAFLNKALKTYEEINAISGIAEINNLIAEIYLKSGNYNNANSYLSKSIQLYEEKKDKKGIAVAEKNIGIVNKKNGNYPAAKMHLQRSLEAFQDQKEFEYCIKVAKDLMDIYLREGNYSSANRYYDLIINYNDSILENQSKNNLQVQKLTLTLNIIDNEKSLSEKDTEIIKMVNRAKQKNIIFYTVILICAIIIILYLFIFFKNKRISGELDTLKEQSTDIEQKFEARSKEIQEKINAKINAEQTRDMLNTVMEQIEESVIITGLDRKIVYVNNHFEKMTGFKREEVIGEIADFFVSGKLTEKIMSRLSLEHSWIGNLNTKHKNGSILYEEAIIFPLRNTGNKIRYYAAIKRDISERIINYNMIEKSEAIMNSMLVHNQNPVLLVDPQYSILICNPKAMELCKEIFGDEIAENETVLKYIPQDELKNFKLNFEKVFEGESVNCEKTIKGVDNNEYKLKINFDPVETENREVLAVLLNVKDKSEI